MEVAECQEVRGVVCTRSYWEGGWRGVTISHFSSLVPYPGVGRFRATNSSEDRQERGAKVAELHVDELANKNPKVARLHVYRPMRGGGPHESESRLSLECRFLSREVLVCFLAQGHCGP